MSLRASLWSQAVNLRVFRAYFPLSRVLRHAVEFPLRYRFGDGRAARHPSIIDINLTDRCNLSCRFCNNADSDTRRADELSFDDLRRLITRNLSHRPGYFLSGGEPLLRADLFDLLELIRSHDLPLGLVTNGTLLSADRVDRLTRIGVNSVVTSLHGDEADHDALVGLPGAFMRTFEGLRRLSARMPAPGPMINYVLDERSVASLPAFLERVRPLENVVVRLAHLGFVTPTEAEAHRHAWGRVFPDWPSRLLQYVHEVEPRDFEALSDILADPENRRVLTKPRLRDQDLPRWYSERFTLQRRCLFVWHSAFISANGDILPCQFHQARLGNVRTDHLPDVWNGDHMRRLRRRLRHGLLPGCARCCKL
jgi:AdoMet-dependent heme synthase